MYVTENIKRVKDKEYRTTLVLESFREDGKIKHKTIANISKLPPHAIDAVKSALKNQPMVSISEFTTSSGKGYGCIDIIKQIAGQLGVIKALGKKQDAMVALFQIAGRIICQGSRNYLANEWAETQDIEAVFELENIYKEMLYKNLDYLAENQDKIEKRLFKHRMKSSSIDAVYLYDVTSSYFEGSKNELAEYGYNRDKKAGKKQIVIGLMTDKTGFPISVEVFSGNTSDPKTVLNQLKKLKKLFGVEKVIFVGDKGMIKSTQIKDIQSFSGEGSKWHYLTTITKAQITKMINEDTLDYALFDKELHEVTIDGVRYIFRRNPVRSEFIKENRLLKELKISNLCEKYTTHLLEHPKSAVETFTKKLDAKMTAFGLKGYMSLVISERSFSIEIDKEAKLQCEMLDGCYVMKTDVPATELTMEDAEDRYKSLNEVEQAFRTIKTTEECIRPIYLVNANRTRGHVFVCMLAYMINKTIKDRLKKQNPKNKEDQITLQGAIDNLNSIQSVLYTYGNVSFKRLPDTLTEKQSEILRLLDLRLTKL